MMEKSQNKITDGRGKKFLAHRCKECGKEGTKSHIKEHIEANHLEGIVIPCNIRLRNTLRLHKLRQHKN